MFQFCAAHQVDAGDGFAAGLVGADLVDRGNGGSGGKEARVPAEDGLLDGRAVGDGAVVVVSAQVVGVVFRNDKTRIGERERAAREGDEVVDVDVTGGAAVFRAGLEEQRQFAPVEIVAGVALGELHHVFRKRLGAAAAAEILERIVVNRGLSGGR